ncbi:MAG TPA: hypothetical protein VKB86_06775 [Pyrinomonadaceae bacterium]|nr:hypothetical protein [Pyrinomonadaceae bacterium]
MYCPRCGQQQASEEMRFCSRCGFPLSGVTELLVNDGVLRSVENESQEQMVSPRRKGISQGVLIMLAGAVVVPVLGVLNHYLRILEPMVALSALLFFLGGFVRILYAIFFEKGASGKKILTPAPDTSAELSASSARTAALPPAQSIPVSDFTPRRANTAELVTPPSVTENTTRLLDEDKAKRGE